MVKVKTGDQEVAERAVATGSEPGGVDEDLLQVRDPLRTRTEG